MAIDEFIGELGQVDAYREKMGMSAFAVALSELTISGASDVDWLIIDALPPSVERLDIHVREGDDAEDSLDEPGGFWKPLRRAIRRLKPSTRLRTIVLRTWRGDGCRLELGAWLRAGTGRQIDIEWADQ